MLIVNISSLLSSFFLSPNHSTKVAPAAKYAHGQQNHFAIFVLTVFEPEPSLDGTLWHRLAIAQWLHDTGTSFCVSFHCIWFFHFKFFIHSPSSLSSMKSFPSGWQFPLANMSLSAMPFLSSHSAHSARNKTSLNASGILLFSTEKHKQFDHVFAL